MLRRRTPSQLSLAPKVPLVFYLPLIYPNGYLAIRDYVIKVFLPF
jgi:hypothetical protein